MTLRQSSDDELRRVLHGTRIVVTRPGIQGDELVARLAQLGATAIRIEPLTITPPTQPELLDRALDNMERFDWLAFTSANAVRAVAERMQMRPDQKIVRWPRVAAIGGATAAAVEALGIPVTFVSTQRTGAGFGSELPTEQGDHLLLPRAENGLLDFAVTLRARGVQVTDVVAYRMASQPDIAQSFSALATDRIDALTFASPSAVVQFLLAGSLAGWSAARAQATQGLLVVCIGPTTAAAARAQQLRVDAIASEPSQEGLVRALALCMAMHDTSFIARTPESHV